MSQIMRVLADLGTSMAAKERRLKIEETELVKEDEGSHIVEAEIKKEDVKATVKSENKQNTSGGSSMGKKKKKGGKR